MAQKAVAYGMLAVVGMNDSATGANVSPSLLDCSSSAVDLPRRLWFRVQLPSMQVTYGVSADAISLVFLANTAG